MGASERDAITAAAPGSWRLEWLVCVDWYDGVESGFVVLDGPVRLGIAVERLGSTGHVMVYRAWLLPTGAAEVIGCMGENDVPAEAVAEWRRARSAVATRSSTVVIDLTYAPGATVLS